MPSTDVELSGMTINLIEDKATFDAMTKNPNEMYLVEKDYELEFNVLTGYDTSLSQYHTTIALVSGDVQAVWNKAQASENDYFPRAKFNMVFVYSTGTVYRRSLILDSIAWTGLSDGEYHEIIYNTNESLNWWSSADSVNRRNNYFTARIFLYDGQYNGHFVVMMTHSIQDMRDDNPVYYANNEVTVIS